MADKKHFLIPFCIVAGLAMCIETGWAGENRFFRILGTEATGILKAAHDGTLTWTNTSNRKCVGVVLGSAELGLGAGLLPAAEIVPITYQGLYRELDRTLNQVKERLHDYEPVGTNQPLYALELTVANANRGRDLLEPQTLARVKVTLDAFQSLGAKAVTVAVNYPVLVPGFPQEAEYMGFYSSVVKLAHARGLKVMLKTGAAFRQQSGYGKLPVENHYRGLTPDRYMREKRLMAERVVQELKPDYLTVANEPDTAAKNTGLDHSPDAFLRYVKHITQGLPHGQTKIGAGAGTWAPPIYWQRLAAETSVDYLDLHVYPINHPYLTTHLSEATQAARKHGKKLVVGEAWLYKLGNTEVGRNDFSANKIFAGDIYSFWSPLDGKFMEVMDKWSKSAGCEYLSFFWVQHLFGGVAYTEELDRRPPGERQAMGSRVAVGNIVKKQPSGTGKMFQHIAGMK